ncbi:MAG TPA: dihydrodipicolinate synthase family protein [Fimbriimonas sp.]|nr:dihydrodipicolinate synthase family protein [Fimbriimonas sp.]
MVYPAAVTPLDGSGQIDYPSVAKLLAWFRAAGCDGVVVSGTNGEGPSLSAVEKRDLMRQAISLSEGLRVVLGISTNSLTEAQWLTSQAAKAGAEAVLVMPPNYFVECGQEGLIGWFTAVLDSAELPVILYNLPKRTGIRIESETVAHLASHPKMMGVKDSSGEEANLQDFSRAAPGKRLLVGDETLLLKALGLGWSGTISGASNVLARWIVAVADDFKSNPESAEAKFALIGETLAALRSAPQPYTNKEILTRLGVIERSAVRLPLSPRPGDAVERVAELVNGLVHK